jgi:hypothetical protein
LAFTVPKILANKKDKGWFKKIIKLESNTSEGEIKSSLSKTLIFIISLVFFGFFIGTGSGNGFKLLKKIETGEIDHNDRIKFIDGDYSKVEIVGSNSSFIFYLEKGNKTVMISPINGIIKSIEVIK